MKKSFLLLAMSLTSFSAFAAGGAQVKCGLYNQGDFTRSAFQEVSFSALTLGDTATPEAPKKIQWDANSRAYPYRYIRFRSAGYILQAQRLLVPFGNGAEMIRLAIYRSSGNTESEHIQIKARDLKELTSQVNFEAKDSEYGVTIKCSVDPL